LREKKGLHPWRRLPFLPAAISSAVAPRYPS
jgi:hypothetical protein